MFWDLLAYDYDLGQRDPVGSAEDARVQDAMFRALRTLLLQSSRAATQHAALHGLATYAIAILGVLLQNTCPQPLATRH
jgi:hypothetical protein